MSEKGSDEVIRQMPEPNVLVVTLDAMGQISVQFPQNMIVTLGMLDYAHEFFMARVVRPTMRPAVEAVQQLPRLVNH